MTMSTDTQMIITGQDPRGLPEFSAMREEINKASHPAQPVMNWTLVESLALSIFKTNGVDLHTATYYTLARTRTQGLAGFCEGVELMAALINREWDKFWPKDGSARTEMLDWFNARTGNILRQQTAFSAADMPLLYRVERALQIICDKLQQVSLKRSPRVENLLYFVQNTRKRYEPQPETTVAAKTKVRTLVYMPEGAGTIAIPETPLPELPEVRVAVQGVTADPQPSATAKAGSTVKGFAIGVLCSAVVAAALWWWQVYPLRQLVAAVQDTAQGAATVWLASPQLSDYPQRLQQLTTVSPLQMLESGQRMTRLADSRWPESLQQEQATATWNTTLKARAADSPQMLGWQQTRTDLRSFAELLIQRERAKEGFTLSSIKTVIYQAERTLNQETPLEYLLTKYQQAKSVGQNTGVLEKQINERIDGVLSRWLLLTHDPLPETPDGKPEK
ncbi:VasL domain-containing protein [Enterobacter cloacae]|uniref:VasL domain-containing protein n=1 Tax=Enterobacter cloacae TaxID=550 RepID=UPI003A4C59BA